MSRASEVAVVVALLAVAARPGVAADPVTFDFDTGAPALLVGQVLPLEQTSRGLLAHFAGDLSVQDAGSTGFYLTMLQGRYLYPNAAMAVLDVAFSRPVTAITLAFATSDSHQSEVPTTVKLIAYLGSKGTPPVGSVTTHATYGSATFPEGTLTFDSGGLPFDLVELSIPPATLAATGFLVDAISVTPMAHVPHRHLRRPGH